MWPFKAKARQVIIDADVDRQARLAMSRLYPDAVAAADVVAAIERQRAMTPVFRYGYECLFIGADSTRPSMEFSLYPDDLNAANWRVRVLLAVQDAGRRAVPGEAVYFDPD